MDFPRKPRHCNSITEPSTVIVRGTATTSHFPSLCLFPHPQINPGRGQSAALVAPWWFSCQHPSSVDNPWLGSIIYVLLFGWCMAAMHHLQTARRNIPGAAELCERRGKEFKSFFKWEKLVIYGSWKERREGGVRCFWLWEVPKSTGAAGLLNLKIREGNFCISSIVPFPPLELLEEWLRHYLEPREPKALISPSLCQLLQVEQALCALTLLTLFVPTTNDRIRWLIIKIGLIIEYWGFLH